MPVTDSPNVPLTSVSQFKDVKPTDKYYPALQSLVERYGVVEAYSDRTFRGGQPLTREQFVVILNSSLDRLNELIATAEADYDPQDDTYNLGIAEYMTSYDANETNITSISQLKDIKASYSNYQELESMVERYGIILADKDKNFRPQQAVTEKEFYLWISKIFSATVSGTQSATKPITRGDAIMIFNSALDSINDQIMAKSEKYDKAREQKRIESKTKIIQNLPSKGRAQIVKTKFYARGNKCADLSAASAELKSAYADDGVWGDYRINVGDSGDIVYETSDTCAKGKIVLLRVGTAIVTMTDKGIKRLK